MASSAVVPAEAPDLPTGDSSAKPKVNHQLRCSPSATSGYLVVDMGPPGTDDGGGGSTRPPSDIISCPCPGVHLVLAFDDLTYSVKQPKCRWFFHQSGRRPIEMASGERAGNNNNGNTRTLLDGISGEAREGEILAVLGASSSGKSTLIDALAGRIQRSSLHGSVTLNEPLDSNLLKVISAHVMQDDLLYPMLTVEETLTYSAELRLPHATPASTEHARVQALIDQLGLRAAARAIISDEGRHGVSGGERRRVSIGVDVVHDPVVLFLDEPTSGLDSTSAFMVTKALWAIALSCSVVVMSIHQPSYQNPAEFALDTIHDLEGTPGGTQKLVDLSKSWWQQKKAAFVVEEYLSLTDAIGVSIAWGKMVSSGTTGGDTTTKNKVLLVSSYANPWPHPGHRVLAPGQHTQGRDRAVRLLRHQHRHHVLRQLRCAAGLPRRPLHLLPRDGTQRVSPLLLRALQHARRIPTAAAALSRLHGHRVPAVGLAGGAQGCAFFTLIVLASFWAGSGFVTFLSAMIPHVIIGYTVVVAVLAYFLLFSGFLITGNRIQGYWIWFHYLSLIKYP
ncbi:hypothetical protein QOZ80_7BG0593770 [Eleusine coracana subsp. coracana]|nr:hypothetical protein QOZ80_7BG0593770 [Eleusine coracana subsp. coracana]